MVRKRAVLILVLGLVTGLLVADEEQDLPQNIILIGWDGAQRDHVNQCLKHEELPNLQKLIDEGKYVEIDIEGKTDTKAGWAQILTGYYPAATGVYGNRQYRPIPEGLTIFERLEKHFGPENIVTLAVIGKKGNVDAGGPRKIRVDAEPEKQAKQTKKKRAPEGRIIEQNGVKYRIIPGKPYYYTKDNMDLFENGLMLDDKVGRRAVKLLEKYRDKRVFFFVHFAEVDHKGHRFAENSKEYNDALISADHWTGKIMDKLHELGLYEKTLIYVSADHGFDEGANGHGNAPYVFLATNDKKVIRHGLRQDITPTIIERFGADITKLNPPLDGFTLTKPCSRPKPVIGQPQKAKQPARPAPKSPGQQTRRPHTALIGPGLDRWLDELSKAYERNDREKMGRLIERMRQQRQRMQDRRAEPNRSAQPKPQVKSSAPKARQLAEVEKK